MKNLILLSLLITTANARVIPTAPVAFHTESRFYTLTNICITGSRSDVLKQLHFYTAKHYIITATRTTKIEGFYRVDLTIKTKFEK